MNRKQWLALAGIVVLALLLAFPLRDAVYQILVVPLAYFFWVFSLYYQTFSQVIIWAGLMFIVVLIFIGSLLGGESRKKKEKAPKKSLEGPIEEFSTALKKAEAGVYYRWRIANRLAKLARELLAQREGMHVNEVHANGLSGRDWSPPSDLDEYFRAGLYGSFASYPRSRWPFSQAEPTPLDLDVVEAVEFLESQIENDNSA